MPLTFAEKMLSVCHRGAVGARLFHLQNASRYLSASSSSNTTSTTAGPLPLLQINGSFLTTPAVPHASSFSTSSTFLYDKEILTDQIRSSSSAFRPKTYFIDLKEDNQGKRYMKLTEKSNGKKSGKCTISQVTFTFCKPLDHNWMPTFIIPQVCSSMSVTSRHSARH